MSSVYENPDPEKNRQDRIETFEEIYRKFHNRGRHLFQSGRQHNKFEPEPIVLVTISGDTIVGAVDQINLDRSNNHRGDILSSTLDVFYFPNSSRRPKDDDLKFKRFVFNDIAHAELLGRHVDPDKYQSGLANAWRCARLVEELAHRLSAACLVVQKISRDK